MHVSVYPSSPKEVDSENEQRLQLAMAAGRMGIWEVRLSFDAVSDPVHGDVCSIPSPPMRSMRAPTAEVQEPSLRASQLFLSAELRTILGLGNRTSAIRLQTVLRKICAADRPALLKAFRKAVRKGTNLELEVRFSAPPRSPGCLLIRGRLYLDGAGRSERLLGIAIEVGPRAAVLPEARQTQSDLERKLADQLRALRGELDAFYYSVSHDLRAPLRSIRGFNEVLLERHASQLDARGREFLRRACESSQFMDRLMDDLLKLSRLGRAELTRRRVDLSQLAASTVQALQASDPTREAVFRIAPGLEAMGDERLLRNVLESLLGNAWKFTSKKPQAQIEFGFAPSPTGAFFVRDNGAGFDPAYAGRLFGVFQRLHAENEFPGTGVGLAIVQRIISRHGGRVWAEGILQGGATFFFTLPNDEPH